MRSIDLKSVLLAGAIGATVLLLVDMFMGASAQPANATSTQVAAVGFGVGAAVQIGMRVSGVS